MVVETLQYDKEAMHLHTIWREGGHIHGRGKFLCDTEPGKPLPPDCTVKYIQEKREMLTAAGVWQDITSGGDHPVDYTITVKRDTSKRKEGNVWKIDKVLDADGLWWQWLPFGNQVQIGDRVLLTGKPDEPVQVVTVLKLDKRQSGGTAWMVINDAHEIRTGQPVVVGRQ